MTKIELKKYLETNAFHWRVIHCIIEQCHHQNA